MRPTDGKYYFGPTQWEYASREGLEHFPKISRRGVSITPGANTTNNFGYALRAASMYFGTNTTTTFNYALWEASLYSGANTTTKLGYTMT